MANVSNFYTQQPPIANQTIKAILGERVYMANADTAYTDPAARLDGGSPGAGWVDLGIVAGSKVSIAYNKETAYVETGLDRVRRGAYLRGKSAQASFTLEQYDATVISALTGQTAGDVGSIGKKLFIGKEDVIEKALLIVGVNKLDGKEHHTYSKKAALTFGFQDQDDARVVQVTADLYAFQPAGETVDSLYVLYILNAA